MATTCNTEQGWFDFPTIREGGGILSRDFTIAEESGAALDSAVMDFKLSGTDSVALSLSGGSGLTISSTSAGNWVISLDQIDSVSLAPGVYFYTLKTTDADGLVNHYLAGTLQIKDV